MREETVGRRLLPLRLGGHALTACWEGRRCVAAARAPHALPLGQDGLNLLLIRALRNTRSAIIIAIGAPCVAVAALKPTRLGRMRVCAQLERACELRLRRIDPAIAPWRSISAASCGKRPASAMQSVRAVDSLRRAIATARRRALRYTLIALQTKWGEQRNRGRNELAWPLVGMLPALHEVLRADVHGASRQQAVDPCCAIHVSFRRHRHRLDDLSQPCFSNFPLQVQSVIESSLTLQPSRLLDTFYESTCISLDVDSRWFICNFHVAGRRLKASVVPERAQSFIIAAKVWIKKLFAVIHGCHCHGKVVLRIELINSRCHRSLKPGDQSTSNEMR
mmetsp:Transcript_19364/g.41838  ORF Transcript_19364/g.41838 Transcript_19364/m.41838 type:complete len:335 (-) Transcript_19364:265-1269(-)